MKTPRDVSGPDLVKALRVLGSERIRQDGSPIGLTTDVESEFHVTVPNHQPPRVGTFKTNPETRAPHHRLTVDELIGKLDL